MSLLGPLEPTGPQQLTGRQARGRGSISGVEQVVAVPAGGLIGECDLCPIIRIARALTVDCLWHVCALCRKN